MRQHLRHAPKQGAARASQVGIRAGGRGASTSMQLRRCTRTPTSPATHTGQRPRARLRDAREAVCLCHQLAQAAQGRQPRRQLHQLVAGQVQVGQPAGAAHLLRHAGQLAAAQRQALQQVGGEGRAGGFVGTAGIDIRQHVCLPNAPPCPPSLRACRLGREARPARLSSMPGSVESKALSLRSCVGGGWGRAALVSAPLQQGHPTALAGTARDGMPSCGLSSHPQPSGRTRLVSAVRPVSVGGSEDALTSLRQTARWQRHV